MFLCLFLPHFIFSAPVHPIIIVPMMYGTNLYATYNNAPQLKWYCPKKLDHELIWARRKFFFPPFHNCLFQMMTNFWDNKTQQYLDFPGVNITVPEFNNEEGLKYVDYGIFKNLHFYESLIQMLSFLHKKGYEIGKTMFTAPYDWRIAPLGIPDFWPRITKAIEDAYILNGEQKVILYGFSLGGSLLIRLLGYYVNPEWKSKYIEKLILLAPSFGGTGDSIDSIYHNYSPLFTFYHSPEARDIFTNIPVTHCHLLNHIIYNFTVISSPEKNYTASRVYDALVENHKVTQMQADMVKYCADNHASKPPSSPGVNTYLIFNTQIKTKLGINYSLGLSNKKHSYIYSGGDGTIPEAAMHWACDNWDTSNSSLSCIDISQDNRKAFNHAAMGQNEAVLNLIHKIMIQKENNSQRGTKKLIMKKLDSDNLNFEL